MNLVIAVFLRFDCRRRGDCEQPRRVLVMSDPLEQLVGDRPIGPISLSPDQEMLCQRLDHLHSRNGLRSKPSEMFRGALFVSRSGLRSNPDWMAQAANSLREILYPFKLKEGLERYGSVLTGTPVEREAGRVFGLLTKMAHHGGGNGEAKEFTAEDFDRLLADFERVMSEVLQRQVDIHNGIDELVALDPMAAGLD